MLEFDDIQHILLTRTPALTGRYEFLSFRSASGGRAWLNGVLKTVQSAADVLASVDEDKRWVTVAFTWNGLKALGVDETSLATFPEEFKQGMPARAEMLGDTGANHPDNWVGGLASPDLHAIAILFARDEAERERCNTEHQRFLAECEGVEVLSSLDLLAIPPFDTAHDHFGYRDRLSQPVIEGSGDVPTPGSGAPLKPGEFILGYPDESGRSIDCRNRKFCLETAAIWPIAGCRSMSEGFATFCASMVRLPRSRNSWRQSSWVDGGAALH